MDDQNTQSTSVKEQTPKQQVVESLKSANNVLVTISTNPTVDQLSACIGLTLMMNKLGKHATAVFSGAIPSTLEFLEPEKTIEQNTDSLRDFIISLDKSKADKLRYKVEDEVVRIYITPYRTSISDADLEFTQGDFNVDVVVALGIDSKEQLDGAIMEHGQILHDATVIDMSCGQSRPVDMGSINWHDATASSLCEMLVSISESFQTGLLDTQMATAYLTGIVSETERFSNDKTTPKVMTMSAQLMAAGANQQLIANQLTIQPEPAVPEQPVVADLPPATETAPGELSINHAPEEPEVLDVPTTEQGSTDEGLQFSVREEPKQETSAVSADAAVDLLGTSGTDVTDTSTEDVERTEAEKEASQIEIDEHGKMVDLEAADEEKAYAHKQKVIQPLNVEPEGPKTDLSTVNLDDPRLTQTPEMLPESPSVDTASIVQEIQAQATEAAAPASDVPNPADQPPIDTAGREQTLEDLEKAVDSPHIGGQGAPISEAEAKSMAEAGYVPEAPSSMPAFPMPDSTENTVIDPSQPIAPPAVPPPLVPPYMQPSTPPADEELNLPNPQ